MLRQEYDIRVDLAVALRICAKLGMHEGVANHFSAAVSEDGKKFLLNPKWVHFSQIKASDLVLLDADDSTSYDESRIDTTAWAIHGQIHALMPSIRVVMHLHPIYATAISCLKNPVVLPIEQNSARYFNRISYDMHYGGMADNVQEGRRLASLLKENKRLMMGNHGVLVVSDHIGVAFDDIYTLERSCQILVNAYATGQALHILSDDIAEKTAQDWEKIDAYSQAHFEQMKAIVVKEDPSVLD